MAQPTSSTGLNAASASLLGLLAIERWPRAWTSYELAKQAGRSLHWFWPRAQRRLLAIPKTLVELGYAGAHDHATGRRVGTRYTITDAGRAALHDWLGEESPDTGINLEVEELIRVFFGDQGSVDQLRAAMQRIGNAAAQGRAELADIVANMDDEAMRGRENVNALSIRLVADVHEAVDRWAAWALKETAQWESPDAAWAGAQKVFDDVAQQRSIRGRP